MLRVLPLAALGWTALVVISGCTLPVERDAPKVRKAVYAAPQTPWPRAATPAQFPAPPRAAHAPRANLSSFPKHACKGPRVAEGEVEGGKIVSGWKAHISDWPGFVAIRMRTEASPDAALYFCGGSAIDPHWVLTAAHCVHEEFDGQDGRGLFQDMMARYPDYNIEGKGYLEVVAGTDQISAPADPRSVRVKQVIVYPGYTNTGSGRDIALLELAQPLPGPFARLSLSSETDPPDVMPIRAMVVGFGRTVAAGQSFQQFATARGGTGLAMSDVLLETTVPTARKGKCVVGDARICAAEERFGGRDSCSGDSGGPLVVFDRHRCPYVIGLTSYGAEHCGLKNTFGVYTRISDYAKWIRTYVPLVGTTPVPFDRAGLEKTYRSVWASVASIESKAAAVPSARRVTITLCKPDGPGCVPRNDDPLADGESFRVVASAPAGRIVLLAVSSQAVVRQLYPVDASDEASSTVVTGATSQWHFDEGRLIALAIQADAKALSEISRARDAEGRVADTVAYMREVEAAAHQASTAIGVLELSVRQ